MSEQETKQQLRCRQHMIRKRRSISGSPPGRSVGIFPSRSLRKDAEPFTIVIPPPNVTGMLHIGHALDFTLQDIIIRTKRMQDMMHCGCRVLTMQGLLPRPR